MEKQAHFSGAEGTGRCRGPGNEVAGRGGAEQPALMAGAGTLMAGAGTAAETPSEM